MLTRVDSTETLGGGRSEKTPSPESHPAVGSTTRGQGSISVAPVGVLASGTQQSSNDEESGLQHGSYLGVSSVGSTYGQGYQSQTGIPCKDDRQSPKYITLKPMTDLPVPSGLSAGALMPMAAAYPKTGSYRLTPPELHQNGQLYQSARHILDSQLYPEQTHTAYAQQGYGSSAEINNANLSHMTGGQHHVSGMSLSPTESTLVTSNTNYSSSQMSKASVYLCNRDLWTRFHAHTTEMIITKQGR